MRGGDVLNNRNYCIRAYPQRGVDTHPIQDPRQAKHFCKTSLLYKQAVLTERCNVNLNILKQILLQILFLHSARHAGIHRYQFWFIVKAVPLIFDVHTQLGRLSSKTSWNISLDDGRGRRCLLASGSKCTSILLS